MKNNEQSKCVSSEVMKKDDLIEQYGIKKISINGFIDFCKNNMLLVGAVTITMFFTYGIKLFYYNFGGAATDSFMLYFYDWLNRDIIQGRAVNSLLYWLRWREGFNPYTSFFSTFCLIWFFSLSWCYIIAIFDSNTDRNNKLIPFALVFMTMPIWADQFYYIFQAPLVALIITLCPYIIYNLYIGFLSGSRKKIIIAVVLLSFMISMYQAIIPLFFFGVCACFLLWRENISCEPRIYRKLCLQLAVSLIVSIMIYFILFEKIIPALMPFDFDNRLYALTQWGNISFKESFLYILLFCYTITVGHIQQAQDIVIPIIMNYSPQIPRKINMLNITAKITGNILLFPLLIAFFIKLGNVVKSKIISKQRLLYILAGIGIPLSFMIFSLIAATIPNSRTLFSLPFATAFMFFFVIKTSRKKTSIIITVVALCLAFYQAEVTARLFYSDQIRFNEDVRLAYELGSIIQQNQTEDKNLPVAFVGKYDISKKFQKNYIKGQSIGHSMFEYSADIHSAYITTIMAIYILKILGMHFDEPNEEQISRAQTEVMSMPAYPDTGYIKVCEDMIIVKISNRMYDE